MNEVMLSSAIIARLERIYGEMEKDYETVASELGFSCQGCPDNCCDSYFLHYTYIEWSYLWRGISELGAEKQKEVVDRARQAILQSETALRLQQRPQIMCPLNEKGLCLVYTYRLMVCRTHGVPAVLTRPDGRQLSFPGCFRCQEQLRSNEDPPRVERTAMLQELALLENEFLDHKRHLVPKVRLTIAQMLVKGPPQLPFPFNQK